MTTYPTPQAPSGVDHVPLPPGLIYRKIADVMRDMDAIGKTRRNTQGQGYNFRGIDDLYNELHEHMAKHGIFTMPRVLSEHHEERQSKHGGVLIYRILKVEYRFYAEDGSFVEAIAIGEAMDSGDKASNKAMSAAHKYALLQAFCVPTEEPKDTEEETHEVAPKGNGKAKAKAEKPSGGGDTASDTGPYCGTEAQREVLRKAFVSWKVTSNKDKHAIGEAMKGKPMTNVNTVIKNYLSEKDQANAPE